MLFFKKEIGLILPRRAHEMFMTTLLLVLVGTKAILSSGEKGRHATPMLTQHLFFTGTRLYNSTDLYDERGEDRTKNSFRPLPVTSRAGR